MSNSPALTPAPATLSRRLSIAPMMAYTTRDFRYLARLITRRTLLYTEMVVAPAVIHGDREKLLGFDAAEHPLAVQLGGSDPGQLAEAARVCADFGYDEINLNVGCPSDRVQQGKIGAVLMAEPEQVARCVEAMAAVTDVPVTVKTRIGIDDQDDYAFLHRFVAHMDAAGCRSLTIHARKAILDGLSPKENRDIPPLIHERAYAIKRDFPHLEIILNGGLKDIDGMLGHLDQVDGLMVGREAYMNPWFLADVDMRVFGDNGPAPDRMAVAEAFLPYLERRYAAGVHPKHVLRHALNLFQAIPGARAYRRHLSENAHKPDATPRVYEEALALLGERALGYAAS
ncbi:tRNA dihydrouridine(20/20a) synthase DusA [Alloalcanivorax sp. C16-2]|uniref:tRNA dihydrouridine(20/20a) synthase DusA n=1 Tax=Alloalcanivorax TaxID=3020832 RepID=UPI001934A9A5|nr:tRNA dihydrouridine(20/20a) synthase DusA [Alloalcanivorax marinus]MBL7249617.1 tRNA dihydrouridine(20/20a) synthase DusA [Alloalcanivorax marinus]